MKHIILFTLIFATAKTSISRGDDYLNIRAVKIPVINGKEGVKGGQCDDSNHEIQGTCNPNINSFLRSQSSQISALELHNRIFFEILASPHSEISLKGTRTRQHMSFLPKREVDVLCTLAAMFNPIPNDEPSKTIVLKCEGWRDYLVATDSEKKIYKVRSDSLNNTLVLSLRESSQDVGGNKLRADTFDIYVNASTFEVKAVTRYMPTAIEKDGLLPNITSRGLRFRLIPAN